MFYSTRILSVDIPSSPPLKIVKYLRSYVEAKAQPLFELLCKKCEFSIFFFFYQPRSPNKRLIATFQPLKWCTLKKDCCKDKLAMMLCTSSKCHAFMYEITKRAKKYYLKGNILHLSSIIWSTDFPLCSKINY